MVRRNRSATTAKHAGADNTTTRRGRNDEDSGTDRENCIGTSSSNDGHDEYLQMESKANEPISMSSLSNLPSEESHQSESHQSQKPLSNDMDATCLSGTENVNEMNNGDDIACNGDDKGVENDEMDQDVDEFMHNMPKIGNGYEDEDEENDHENHPRPTSANSIASFSSSVLKKIQASNVFQETSTVFNEVIKHTTFCGVQRADGNGNERGNDNTSSGYGSKGEYQSPVLIEEEQGETSLSACPPPEAIPIPLRHIQSSPTQSQHPVVNFNNGAGNGPTMMKRSVSTPPTFSQSRRGSAFGKVYSTQYQMHRAQNAMGSGSAFQPVGMRNNALPLPLSRAVSIDAGSVASTDEVSVASSTSKMSAKAQNRIKARRRKMKQQKNSVPVNAVSASEKESSDTLNESFCSEESSATATIALSSAIAEKDRPNAEVDFHDKQAESIVPPPALEVKSSMDTPVVSNAKMVKKVKAIRRKRGGFSNPFKKQVDPVSDSVITQKVSSLDPVIADAADPGPIPIALDISNDRDAKDVSYLPLHGDNDTETETIDGKAADVEGKMFKEEAQDVFTELRGNESPTPIPFPAYQKINDDDNVNSNIHATCSSNPPLPSQPRRRSKGYGNSSPSTAINTQPSSTNSTQPRLILPLGNRSPCSQDSCSYSKSTRSGQSLNTTNNSQSHFSSTSCNRSVTSSVAEADREVRETNRRELRRFEMVDMDGTQSIQSVPSIQSSDTTSTNPHAYLALNSSNAQLREGASMPFDRFFARNGSSVQVNGNINGHGYSYGPSVGSGSHSNSSSVHLSLVLGNGTSGRPPAMNARSPNTISSNSHSLAHSVSTASTGDDHHRPPSFISAKLSKKVAPAPSPSDGVGYSRLGSGSDGMMLHGMSSGSSKSSSMSSKSSSSKSRRKGKKDMTQRSYQKMRTSTPSPCNSFPASPVKTPISPPNEFNFMEPTGVRKPDVRRQAPSNHYGMNHNYNHIPSQKMVLVSPDGASGPSFQPSSRIEPVTFRGAFRGVVTPEKRSIEEHMSRFRM